MNTWEQEWELNSGNGRMGILIAFPHTSTLYPPGGFAPIDPHYWLVLRALATEPHFPVSNTPSQSMADL